MANPPKTGPKACGGEVGEVKQETENIIICIYIYIYIDIYLHIITCTHIHLRLNTDSWLLNTDHSLL